MIKNQKNSFFAVETFQSNKIFMMKKLMLLPIATLIVISFLGCSSQNQTNLDQENLVLATLWFQKTPEAKALYLQGFNIAKERVLEFKKSAEIKPQAVVVDLDETMIDNSPFQGKMIQSGMPFSNEMWGEWTSLAVAKAMPGAVEFTQFCDSVGVDVIYISNRSISDLAVTMQNMTELGFKFVDENNFYLKEEKSGKEPRREKVSEKFDIVLLLGDNLNDFSEVFENRGDDWGVSLVNQYKNEFGRRFIIFPNPMYGEWEKNVYQHQKNLTEKERFSFRRKAIESF